MVQHKLVPLILESRDDAVLVNTLLKIYVMLTMPLSKLAEEALSKPINPKAQGDVRDQQTRRRENATAQQVISIANSFETTMSIYSLLDAASATAAAVYDHLCIFFVDTICCFTAVQEVFFAAKLQLDISGIPSQGGRMYSSTTAVSQVPADADVKAGR